MCDKHNTSRIDKCMRELIAFLNQHDIKTVACCCGHGKYRMTIVVDIGVGLFQEICNFKIIERKKRFYRKDKEGYYYIPEVSKS